MQEGTLKHWRLFSRQSFSICRTCKRFVFSARSIFFSFGDKASRNLRRPRLFDAIGTLGMVGGGWALPLWKRLEFVNWDYDYSQIYVRNKTCSKHFQTTNQVGNSWWMGNYRNIIGIFWNLRRFNMPSMTGVGVPPMVMTRALLWLEHN